MRRSIDGNTEKSMARVSPSAMSSIRVAMAMDRVRNTSSATAGTGTMRMARMPSTAMARRALPCLCFRSRACSDGGPTAVAR